MILKSHKTIKDNKFLQLDFFNKHLTKIFFILQRNFFIWVKCFNFFLTQYFLQIKLITRKLLVKFSGKEIK